MQAREDIVTDYLLERKEGKDNKEVNVVASPTSVQAAYLAIKEMKCLNKRQWAIYTSTFRCKKPRKSRFKDARRKATEAFSNEARSTSDRLLAMQFRVMSTLLEKIDVPADALLACRLCLEELHAVPVITESFKVQLKRGFKSRFNKSERKEIMISVCRLNRAIYDVSQMVSDDTNLLL